MNLQKPSNEIVGRDRWIIALRSVVGTHRVPGISRVLGWRTKAEYNWGKDKGRASSSIA